MARPAKKLKSKPDTFVVHFKPLSDSQRRVLDLYPKCDVLFVTGPAGSGKTMAAVGAAMLDIHGPSPRNQLLVLRPAIETGKTLGYLPGGVDEKILPYMGSFTQALKKVAYNVPPEVVSFEALGFQRGMSYEDAVVILDESQNASFAQLTMFLTRLGRNSKLMVLGDPEQTDIRPTVADYDVDLDAAVDALQGLARVGIVEFGSHESLRHPLIGRMLKRLNSMKS